VRARVAVDGVDGFAQVGGDRVGGGDGMRAGLDLDRAIAAGCFHELADGPAGVLLDPAADGQGGEDDGEMSLDGVAQVVLDGPGLQVAFGHPE
jgi:hypothetical protein